MPGGNVYNATDLRFRIQSTCTSQTVDKFAGARPGEVCFSMAVSLTKAYFIAMFCEAVLHGEYVYTE